MNKISISPAFLGFIRGLGVIVIYAILNYIGVADHLTFLSPTTAVVVSAIALWIEHAFSPAGTGVFGSVRIAN
jgi:hypothetical protein